MNDINFPLLIIQPSHYGCDLAGVVRDSDQLYACLRDNRDYDILERATVERLATDDADGWAEELALAATLTGTQVMYRVSESRGYKVAASADHAVLEILGGGGAQAFDASDDPVVVAAALRETPASRDESAKLMSDLGMSAATIAKAMFDRDGLDMSATDIAWVLRRGLDLDAAEIATVLRDGLDLSADVAEALADGLDLDAAE